VTNDPLSVAASQATLITTTTELADLCTRLRTLPFVTFDTEFIRETTYYPKLCLVQLSGRTDLWPDSPPSTPSKKKANGVCLYQGFLVDPLAPDLDLTPLFDLMRDESVLKVVHSGRQDVEIFYLLGNLIPTPLFDTQIAAMVCGYGDCVSYEKLVNDLARAKIDKGSRFSDWAQRPLSDAQSNYALSDVTYLVTVYEALAARLRESEREEWLSQEMTTLTALTTYAQTPEEAWMRLAGRVKRKRDFAVMRALAIWREKEAQERNVPRGRVIKDDSLLALAVSAPTTLEQLTRSRALPTGYERSRTGGQLLAVIQEALTGDVENIELPEYTKGLAGSQATVELLKIFLKCVSEELGVASKILATVHDLEQIARDDEADVPPLQGWRREVFGNRALDLKNGRCALTIQDKKVVIVPQGVGM
jgi:ribonuclease D